MSRFYEQSELMLERALKSIPLGTQTFSKSKTQYPLGVSPFYIDRGQGSHVWDVDGNEYIDFICALDSLSLGYNDPDVLEAVRKQLEIGTIFSLPHKLEIEVAELIIDMVPSAEMVRFGKNGSDATSGAVRAARSYTGRDHIAACGYHGWQDWYIGATARNGGVPKAISDLTHLFTYNDITSLEEIFNQYPNSVAAVIMEPMTSVFPDAGFLLKVQEIAHKNGALFILDETITGFRFANGGAQEYFGLMPDLSTFGKGISNGYPLSAVVGRKEIMQEMEEIFFSFTFGGELLSLAAAKAVLTKLKKEPIIETIANQGQRVINEVNQLIDKYNLQQIMHVSGHPSWSFINISDSDVYSSWEIKTLFLQEMLANGILILGTHNMSYSHGNIELERLFVVYNQVLSKIALALEENNLPKQLRCEPLQPLFKLR